MPQVVRESGRRKFVNLTGATLVAGDIVKLPDGLAGIVEGLRGVKPNETGWCCTRGIVKASKSTTAIAAGARIEYDPSTKLIATQAGSPTSPAFIVGRLTDAAGSGTVEGEFELNGTGPTA